MDHIMLLGDSILDNGSYVPGGPCVLDHLRRRLGGRARATLLAVDGARIANVPAQLANMPDDATHIVLSIGGNDALWCRGNLFELPVANVAEGLSLLSEVHGEFGQAFASLLDDIGRRYNLPVAICTIYDQIPDLSPEERAGLCVFNDVITRNALRKGLPLIDLRTLCVKASDYSSISSIEPSQSGGAKIADAICQLLY